MDSFRTECGALAGVVLFLTQRAMARADPYKYPEGKARLEPLGVIIFAVVMGMSSLQVLHISYCMSSLQILCSYGILVMAY